ncbi:hypothetical protein [Rhizobium sp. Leaf384]|uniref:hypothetical protein n=1 Tax=Rhizobium sp. Leaf384 TaxID=1736358 RepID=UPI000A41F05F|nr:hypothetical protein [Rhizobium sp. Leaf384]
MENAHREAISSVLRGYFPMAQTLTLEEIADEIYNCIRTTPLDVSRNRRSVGFEDSQSTFQIRK